MWKQIKDFPKYECNQFGEVRNIKTKKVLKPYENGNGYLKLCLYTHSIRRVRVYPHRIVLGCWQPYKGSNSAIEVDHLDRNRQNNCLSNLEWVSREENLRRSRVK